MQLSPESRVSVKSRIIDTLIQRLRMESVFRKQPELEESEIQEPVFILGMPPPE